MKLFRKVTAVALAAIMTVGTAPFSASAAEVSVPVNEATKYVDNLGAIWNLGNCFDASDCTWLSNEMDYETAWCGAKVTEKLIKAIKDMGFDTIRIPATWHNHVDGSYNISEQWMDRVEEVVEWSVDEGLYVILNVHHDIDKNYYYPDSEHYDNSEKYMKKVWEQIADEFDDVGNQLIFEIINEPRLKGTNNEWWFQLNNPPENVVDSIDCINKLNQVSLDTIRKAGGKNKDRYILVGGYDTSVDGVTVKGFELADIGGASPDDYFFLRISGDSMKNIGMVNGSLVLFRKQQYAEEGQVVACLVGGESATVKRFSKRGRRIFLLPENPAYSPIELSPADFETGEARILGVAEEIKIKL